MLKMEDLSFGGAATEGGRDRWAKWTKRGSGRNVGSAIRTDSKGCDNTINVWIINPKAGASTIASRVY